MTMLRQLLVRCHCWLAQQWESGTRYALLDKTSSGTLLRSLVGCLFAFTFALTSTAPAAVIERDWRDQGDGLLTFDTVNQREWLDIPETILADFPDGILPELEPGGMFAGFTWATRDDVIDLAISAGIDIETTSLAVNEVATLRLVELLGEPPESAGGVVSTRGIIDESSHTVPPDQIVAGFGVDPIGAGGSFFLFSSIISDRPRRLVGTMLYRQIPEPSTVALAVAFLAATLLAHRTRTIAYAFAGCHCWLAQQWEPGTCFALLDKTSSGTLLRSLVGCLFAFTFALTSTAPAAVIERDWLEPGDGLLTFDTVNQREWLDLNETLLVNFPDFDVLAEIGPGGVFDGFAFSTSDDVIGLATSAGIDTSSLDYTTNHVETQRLVDLLSPTFSTSFAVGYVTGELTVFLQVIPPGSSIADPRAGLVVGPGAGGDLVRPANTGVMLYRQLPEPSTVALSAMLLATIVLARHMR